MAEPFADAYAGALVAEATRKAGLVWLDLADGKPARAAWHVWHDGAAYLIHEGREQPLSGIREALQIRVIVPSKDKGGRIVTWLARSHAVEPGSPEWDSAVRDLHAGRLNPTDGEAQPERWARESQMTRLEPTGELAEQPGSLPDASHAAEPPTTPATTRSPLPFVIGRRARRR